MPSSRLHPALQDFSRDHKRFLSEARNIRWYYEDSEHAKALDETVASLLTFWEEQGELHVREEEEILFPAIANRDAAVDSDLDRLKDDHRLLRESIPALNDMPLNDPEAVRETLIAISQRMSEHVRYEEEFVLPRVQEITTESELMSLGMQSMAFRNQHRKKKP